MAQDAQNKIVYVQVDCVYVLSSSDIERIYSSCPAFENWFFELLESRKIEFPNSYFASNWVLEKANLDKSRQEPQMDLF